MLIIALKLHNLVGKWLWPDVCLKISLLVVSTYGTTNDNMWKESVCMCQIYAVKPQLWGNNNNNSSIIISGKWTCGTLRGVKPQLWELNFCKTQVLPLLKYGNLEQYRAEQVAMCDGFNFSFIIFFE